VIFPTVGGAPVATKSLSWGSHNSNFTMVFVGDISNKLVFMGLFHQFITEGGAPPGISNHQMALEWDLQLSFGVKHDWDMPARNGCVYQS